MEELTFQRDEAVLPNGTKTVACCFYVFYSDWTLQRLHDTTNSQQLLQAILKII
jgi:hypothetical protein